MIHSHRIFARSRRMVPLLMACAVLLALLHTTPRVQAASSTVVISQFQVGGATASDEFIELHNTGASAFDLNGHRLVYRATAGTSDVAVVNWSASTVIPPGGYYLVTQSVGYDGTVAGDTTYPNNGTNGQLAAAGGGLALRNGAADSGTIVDSVGYGTAANAFVEGTAVAAPAANASAERTGAGCADTDTNFSDFATTNPSAPRNSSSPAQGCGAGNTPPVANDDSGPNFATNEDTVLTYSNVPAQIRADVPEATTYQLVYALTNIPANADYDGALPPYSTNNAATVGPFSRVAYYLELDNGSGRRWVYVSMDAFTTDPLRIGVPVGSIAFQQKVTNMNVASNASGVTTGTNIATGNIEFWSNCYNQTRGLGTIGGSDSSYDFNDTRDSISCYGSMQVHNYGTGQTILAYNAWDVNAADEIGIGNAPGMHPDWTFTNNAGTYTVRNLYVLASGAPSVLQNDTDADNDPLTVSAFDATSAQGATVIMQPNGSFTYDPRPSASLNALDSGESVVDTFTYTATDGIASDSAVVSIIVDGVNDAPVATDGSLTTAEDSAASGTLVATDVDGEPLTYSIVTDGSQGSVTITDASTGAFTYTPDPDANGSDSFTFIANDGTTDSNVATVSVTITPVNDAPVAADDSASTSEETLLTVAAPGVLQNDTDTDGDTLTATVVSSTSNGTLTLNADGAFSYTPDADFNGTDSFTYQANDGTTDSTVATVTITIAPVNDAPSFTAGADQTVAEDAGAQTVSGWATSISGGPADEITQTVSFLVTNDNTALFSSQPTIAPDGTLTYTPAPDAFGSATVTAQAQDDGGTANGGSDTSPAQTFTITITAVNDAPVTTDDSYTAAEDSTLTVAAASGVLQNDSDVDGDPLTATVVSSTSNGTLTLNTDGSFSYTPDADYTGTDSFTYTANDGTTDSAVTTVTITVALLGDTPVATDSSLTTTEDTVASDTLIAVDADGNPLTYSLVTNGTQGSVTITDASSGAFTYTPDPDANGTDSFTFQVTDGTSDSNVATVTITITPVNDAPVANDSTLTTAENTAASGVLSATDVDGDALTYRIVTNGTKGVATITDPASGAFTYTPNAGANGSDSITFRASDNTLDSNVATVTITITPSDDVPPTDTATRLYLPLLQRAPALPDLPDLVVESIRVQDGALQVVIANQGGRAVTQPFWVDAYLNPATPPTSVNQTWPMLGERGLAWGLRGGALPLASGARVTLTVGDSAYIAAKSNPGGTLAAGSTVYVQVDSASVGSPYGAVHEADEQNGGTYNNIATLVVETDVRMATGTSAITQAVPRDELPTRPE